MLISEITSIYAQQPPNPPQETQPLEKIIEFTGSDAQNDLASVERRANEYAVVKDASGNRLQHKSIHLEKVTFEDKSYKPKAPSGKTPSPFLYGLAILSDDGCKVTINGKEVLSRFGKGQALPNLKQSFHILPILLSSGTPANIKVEYSNIFYIDNNLNQPDIDGATLFVYSLPETLKLEFPKQAYAVKEVETQVKITLTNRPQEAGKAMVELDLPAGAKLISPAKSPFEMKSDIPKILTVKLPPKSGKQTFVARLVKDKLSSETSVETIKLEEVVAAYTAVTPYPRPKEAYMAALITASGAQGKNMYGGAGDAFEDYGVWWAPNGVKANYDEQPKYTNINPLDWPESWPPLKIRWKALAHTASGSKDHARIYGYNRTPLADINDKFGFSFQGARASPGVTRYQVEIMLAEGTDWEQKLVSGDKELATRVALAEEIEEYGKNNYGLLDYLPVFLRTRYEWGGWWFGGKDSGGKYAGKPLGYDGYGTDCSGYVTAVARLSGYGWTEKHLGTGQLVEPAYSAPVSVDDFEPGDILNKVGDHVVICSSREPIDPENPVGGRDKITIYQSSGGERGVNRQNRVSLQKYIDKKYKPRRLKRN